MKNEVHHVNARIPKPLHKQIVKAAQDNGRSIMGEIVYRLKKSFENESK